MVFPLSSTVTCGCDRITAKETQTISNDPCRINQPADAAIRVEQARAGARGRSGRLAVRAEPDWCEKYKCGVRLFQHALEALQQRSGRQDRRTSRAWRHRAIQHRHSMINGSGFLRELIEIYSQQHPEVAIEIVEGASTEHTSLVRKSAMIGVRDGCERGCRLRHRTVLERGSVCCAPLRPSALRRKVIVWKALRHAHFFADAS